MTFEPGTSGAILSFVQTRADVDRKTEVHLLQFRDECDHIVGVIKDRRNCSGTRNTTHDTFEVSPFIAAPMHGGVQVLRWMKDGAVTGITHVDGIVLASDL